MASKKRVICGLSVATGWVIAIFLLPLSILAALICGAALICLYELSAMLKKKGYHLPFKLLGGFTIGWYFFTYKCCPTQIETLGDIREAVASLASTPLIIALIAMILFFRILLDKKIEKPMETAALSITAFVYIPYMLSYLLIITFLGEAFGKNAGIFLAFSLALVTKMSDTGGYFIGSAFGKHKMCPRLSPGKSWEGTAGGYAFSLIAAGIIITCAHIFDQAEFLSAIRALTPTAGTIAWALLTVVVIVTVGILGDLLESLFKRQCEVKDSSALFPAMGGFFDTFDSLIFVPIVLLLMTLLGFIIFA